MSKYEVEIHNSFDTHDYSEWDDFVNESPQGNIFCRSWWLEAVCPKGFEILVLRKGGRIVAGMPMVRSRKLGREAIHMPRLTQTLGVLLAPPTGQKYETRLSSEMDVLKELVRATPAVDYFSMNFHHSFTNWLPFYWAGYMQTTRYTYIIENLSDLDAVFRNMDTKQRSKIRKAKRSGVVVEEGCDLVTFLELNRKTFARQSKEPSYTREFVRSLDAACARHNARTIFLTKDRENKPHSALYVVYDNKCMYKLMSGADPELRSSGAHALAVWRSIELAHKLNITYDCEGSNIENMECFNRSLGARQTLYFSITKANLVGKAWRALRPYVGRFARAFRSRRW